MQSMQKPSEEVMTRSEEERRQTGVNSGWQADTPESLVTVYVK